MFCTICSIASKAFIRVPVINWLYNINSALQIGIKTSKSDRFNKNIYTIPFYGSGNQNRIKQSSRQQYITNMVPLYLHTDKMRSIIVVLAVLCCLKMFEFYTLLQTFYLKTFLIIHCQQKLSDYRRIVLYAMSKAI